MFHFETNFISLYWRRHRQRASFFHRKIFEQSRDWYSLWYVCGQCDWEFINWDYFGIGRQKWSTFIQSNFIFSHRFLWWFYNLFCFCLWKSRVFKIWRLSKLCALHLCKFYSWVFSGFLRNVSCEVFLTLTNYQNISILPFTHKKIGVIIHYFVKINFIP